MKKKFWLILLAIVSALLLCVGVAACGGGGGGGGKPSGGDSSDISEEEELWFFLNQDGQSYSVSGNGMRPELVGARLVIPAEHEGYPVTQIATSAFEGCNLEEVVIPESVETIGSYAFQNCASLTSVNIPEGVKEIGREAFQSCPSLTSVIIPESLEKIGMDAFSSCKKLAQVNWNAIACEDPVENYGCFFNDCTAEATVIIGEKVERVPDRAFCEFDGLKVVKFEGNALTEIGEMAFGCPNIESVYITDLSAWCKIDFLPGGNPITGNMNTAIYLNGTLFTELKDITGITRIKSDTFNGYKMLESVELPEGVTSIETNAFANCPSLKKLVLPESLTEIQENAFAESPVEELKASHHWVEYLTRYYFPLTLKNMIITGGNASRDFSFSIDTLETVWVAASVESLSSFYNCKLLRSVTFEEGSRLTALRAFQGCTALQSIAIPKGVTELYEGAFMDCTSLTSVTFEEGSELATIEYQAFSGCKSLKSIEIPESVKEIQVDAFLDCGTIENVYITNAKAWCEIDFYNKNSTPLVNGGTLYLDGAPITKLDEEIAGATKIDGYAFYNCKTLQSITIPESVKLVGGGAFQNCSSLSEVVWNASIGDYATGTEDPVFAGCTAEATAVFGDTVRYIPDYALYGFSGLKSVTIGSSVRSIGDLAFSACDALETMEVDPANETYSSEGNCIIHTEQHTLIAGCKTSVIPENVEIIDSYAFYNCDTLKSIRIPENVVNLWQCAFWDCDELESVTFEGGIHYDIDLGHEAFESCDKLESVIVEKSDLYGLVIRQSAFKDCKSLREFDMSIAHWIEDGAFSGCKSLESITLSENFASIGWNAFLNCTGLTTVNWNATNGNTASFGSQSIYSGTIFKGCTSLTHINIGQNVEILPAYLFSDCTEVESIELPSSLKEIKRGAFNNCDALKKVTVPSLKMWCEIDFENASANPLGAGTTLYVGQSPISDLKNYSISEIKPYAFAGYGELTNVTLPNGLKKIGNSAFANCSALETLSIPQSVIEIGENVLNNTALYNEADNWDDSVALYVGNFLFNVKTSVSECVVKDDTQLIARAAFTGCKSLSDLTLPFVGWPVAFSNTEKNYPFGYIFGETNYSGGQKVTQHKEAQYRNETYNFYIPSSLRNVTVKGGKIVISAFESCTMLTSVTIGKEATAIEDYAFKDCSSLSKVTFEEGNKVTAINQHAFDCCSSLESIVIPKGVTQLFAQTFLGCSKLKSVSFEKGSVLSLLDSFQIFGSCKVLESIVIPEGVRTISTGAFWRSDSLQKIYYCGTETKWNEIEIVEGSKEFFADKTIFYYSEETPTEEEWESHDDWWHYDETGAVAEWVKA